MNNQTIYFAKVDKTKQTIIPTKREEDGAFDIYANFKEDFMIIMPHETKMIPTNLASAFSLDYVAILKERGSTGTKGIGQRAGVVDSGYRGEWFVPVTNHNDKPIVIKKEIAKEKDIAYAFTGNEEITKVYIEYPYTKAICQCIMVEVPKLVTQEISYEELLQFKSERGIGALGSSGK